MIITSYTVAQNVRSAHRLLYNSIGEAFSFSFTSTNKLNSVDVKAELENNGQPPPQLLGITVSCIPAATTGSVTIIKAAIGGNGTFSFTGTLGSFQITTSGGSGSQNFANLLPGTSTLNETAPNGFSFTSLTCSAGGSVSGSTATITVAAGQNVTCTYTDTAQVVVRGAEGLAAQMSGMRTWLDHHQVQPALFEFAFLPDAVIRFRLQFRTSAEAAAFAPASRGKS